MNFTQSLKDTASTMAGNIEKAVIEIIDSRKKTVTKQEAVPAAGASGLTSISSLGKTKLVEKTLEKLQVGGNPAADILKEGNTRKYFYVQFNPNQISFSGYGEEKWQKQIIQKIRIRPRGLIMKR